MTSHFQDGGHVVISRKNVLPPIVSEHEAFASASSWSTVRSYLCLRTDEPLLIRVLAFECGKITVLSGKKSVTLQQ